MDSMRPTYEDIRRAFARDHGPMTGGHVVSRDGQVTVPADTVAITPKP